MSLFGDESEVGAGKFIPCPNCGEDEIYSKSNGFLKRGEFLCDSCGTKHRARDVVKVRQRGGGEPDSDEKEKQGTAGGTSGVETLVENAQGPGVTESRLTMKRGVILDSLDEGEQPHCILKGAGYRGIEVETGSEVQRTGVKGAGLLDTLNNSFTSTNITVVTDTRVLALHPLLTGLNEYSIPFESIDNVAVDRGWMKNRIQVTTGSRTYYFEVADDMNDEMKEVVDFIRMKRRESIQQQAVETTDSDSPLDKLERLSELHNQGVLSDKEFGEKKEELLDDI